MRHKNMLPKLSAAAMAVALTFGVSSAQAWTLDFEADGNGVDMVNGQVLDNEYAMGVDGPGSVGVTISARNFNHRHPDKAVVFDSSLMNTRDPDLESPFTPHMQGGPDPAPGSDVFNALQNPGNIVIVQENWKDCSSGVCSRPDDEAKGGYIRFEFDADVTLFSLDVFDIDGPPDPQNEKGEIRFYSDANDCVASHTIDILGNGGDNHSSRIVFAGLTGISNVAALEVEFSSSGALSNLIGGSYQPPVGVPAPAPLMLMAIGLFGLWRNRRQLR